MKIDLRLKLLFSHLALIILAMGLAGVLLLTSLERYFLEATEESLLALARVTSQTLIPGAMTAGPQIEGQSAFSNALQQQRVERNIAVQTQNLTLPSDDVPISELDLSYLSDSSLQLGAQLETHVRILDTSGVILVDSQGEPAVDLSSDDLVAQALEGQYASRTQDTRAGLVMSLALPVMVEGELVGVVYLSEPLRDLNLVLSDLRWRWGGSTAVALVLSGVVGLLLSRAITRPLGQLTQAAGHVAQGDFATEVPVRSRDELGRLSRAFNDMTARLRAARQMQTDFVANVSHELRTPLTSVKGTVETLRAGAVDDVSVRDRFLATVANETDRLIRLVNDLLLLTRADSEALNLRREPLDLAELVRVTVERLRPQADVRDVTVRIESAPDAPLTWADKDRVAQVLLNLLDNALKFSHSGGIVTVRIGAQGDEMAQVYVCDQGIGIPAEHLSRIGERFYRADRARARAAGGSGLGLAIAYALVEAHGGTLQIESQPDAGTTVSFTLPVA